jgi:hypothetical protein
MMARGGPQPWRARKEPVTDDYIRAAVDQSGGLGQHDADGHYSMLVIRGLADKAEAHEYELSLYRCALWLTRHKVMAVSISHCKVEPDGTGFKLTFRVTDKTHARAHHLDTHGTDRSKWSYDPRRRNAS